MFLLDATFSQDTVLDTYLVYEDDNPIKPSFFSFGSGEFKIQVKKSPTEAFVSSDGNSVQIVDIENIDVPTKISCVGATTEKEGEMI